MIRLYLVLSSSLVKFRRLGYVVTDLVRHLHVLEPSVICPVTRGRVPTKHLRQTAWKGGYIGAENLYMIS